MCHICSVGMNHLLCSRNKLGGTKLVLSIELCHNINIKLHKQHNVPSSPFQQKQFWQFFYCFKTSICCILRGDGGERILYVVPRRDGARNSG